jgi:hypothetical protein
VQVTDDAGKKKNQIVTQVYNSSGKLVKSWPFSEFEKVKMFTSG